MSPAGQSESVMLRRAMQTFERHEVSFDVEAASRALEAALETEHAALEAAIAEQRRRTESIRKAAVAGRPLLNRRKQAPQSFEALFGD